MAANLNESCNQNNDCNSGKCCAGVCKSADYTGDCPAGLDETCTSNSGCNSGRCCEGLCKSASYTGDCRCEAYGCAGAGGSGTGGSPPPPPPDDIYGCMDSTANNFNNAATIDDGSCTYTDAASGLPGFEGQGTENIVVTGDGFASSTDAGGIAQGTAQGVLDGGGFSAGDSDTDFFAALGVDIMGSGPESNGAGFNLGQGTTDGEGFSNPNITNDGVNNLANRNQDAGDMFGSAEDSFFQLDGAPPDYSGNGGASGDNDTGDQLSLLAQGIAGMNTSTNGNGVGFLPQFSESTQNPPASNPNSGTIGSDVDLVVSNVSGCTDKEADNYNSAATKDDGSCKYEEADAEADDASGNGGKPTTGKEAPGSDAAESDAPEDTGETSEVVKGCMDSTADNYDKNATSSDDSCKYSGCIDSRAENFIGWDKVHLTTDDGSCIIYGCTDPTADNYVDYATRDDSSYPCTYTVEASADTTQVENVLSPDPVVTKTYNVVNLNLFSGSTDAFRTAVGGFWNIESGSDGNYLFFKQLNARQPVLNLFDSIGTNPNLQETISDLSVKFNRRIPIRIAGSTNVSNDQHWRTLFMGGEFAGETLQPIYTDNLYSYHYFESARPYTKMEANATSNPSAISNQVLISYDYNKYLPKYENYVETLSSELLMPNYYVITDLQSYDVAATSDGVTVEDDSGNPVSYDKDVLNHVTLEGNYADIDGLFTNVPIPDAPSEAETHDKNWTYLTFNYLTSSLVNNPLSSSTENAIKHKFQNIILDDEALNKLYNNDNITQHSSKFPYYVKINLPLTKTKIEVEGTEQTDTTFVDYITDNKYTTKFLKSLKEVFNGDISGQPTVTNYAMAESYISSSNDTLVDTNVESVKEDNLRTVDFTEMMAYNYNNYISETDDCYYVGRKNVCRDSMFDKFGVYRYLNSVSSLKTMANLSEYLSSNTSYNFENLTDFLFQSENSCIRETLAYRIQKVGGTPTGDSRTQNTLQNYWLLNSSELEEFNFVDSQVKYGTDYTYYIYEYVLVLGVRYKFSDLRITKAINSENKLEVGNKTLYGLEFYDPKTDANATQLYDEDEGGGFMTLVQEKSDFPYLADFYLEYEPTALIFEVPVASKTLRVMDNPANAVNIFPYQHMDNSQKIGFEIKYDVFQERTFPTVITPSDLRLKQDYLRAKDFFEDDVISADAGAVIATIPNSDDVLEIEAQALGSISQPRYLEIYRLSEKPKAYTDFANNLIKTIDLKIINSKVTYTTEFFDDKIRTNHKYYYLFRVLNEQNVIGHASEIYETELVNDGGYLYANFNVLNQQDLEENNFTNPIKKFKKLIHIEPNLNQLAFNLDNVDFDKEAASQVSNLQVGIADDLIWDKEFKIRLTSKKTGRKIDLNITYKLN